MNKVKIVVDSCSDLSPELYEKYDLEVLHQNVTFGGKNYRDGVDCTLEQLYASVAETGELPHTAAVSPAVFEECFKKNIEAGYDIVYVGLGDKLSTTFQNAHIAKNNCEEGRVFLVNSASLSSGIGLLAMKAAKLRDEGKTAAEITEICNEMAKNIVAQFAVETLDYLYKGGRCSGAAALVGKLFHVHPYLKVVDGSLIIYKKPRGPMKFAIDEQLNELKAVMPNVDLDNVMITSAGMDKEIEDYCVSKLSEIVPKECIKVTRAGSVIASHCGYGTVGILYITK